MFALIFNNDDEFFGEKEFVFLSGSTSRMGSQIQICNSSKKESKMIYSDIILI